MATFDVWDVIKVPFPYTDLPVRQRRPALVLAIYDLPGQSMLIWVLMITSSSHRRWAGDVVISDLAQAGLPAVSMVRSSKIATIDARDAEAAGSLPKSDRAAVTAFLSASLNQALS